MDPARTLGLYLHFPFCSYKCGYCDFNSWVEKSAEPQRQWLEGVQKELGFWRRERSGALDQFSVDTLFMGGGTPSLLAPNLWQDLCDTLRENFNFDTNLEWTLEANPETISEFQLDMWGRIGVNRVSVGIQSFRSENLDKLERGASPEANRRALDLLSQKWSGRWSLDLMFGLPHQELGQWIQDLRTALDYRPSHVSAYQLTLTTQKSRTWSQGTDLDLLEFFRTSRQELSRGGLFPYEISNFCVPGEECRHNLKYWRAESFLGLGPGAYSLLPAEILDDAPLGAHFKNPSRWEQWLAHAETPNLDRLERRTESQHVTELFMLGLRLERGIERKLFPESLRWEKLHELSHLLVFDEERVWLTDRGREILDTALVEVLQRLEIDEESMRS